MLSFSCNLIGQVRLGGPCYSSSTVKTPKNIETHENRLKNLNY